MFLVWANNRDADSETSKGHPNAYYCSLIFQPELQASSVGEMIARSISTPTYPLDVISLFSDSSRISFHTASFANFLIALTNGKIESLSCSWVDTGDKLGMSACMLE